MLFFDFPSMGESWAYFDHWKRYQKWKIRKEMVWDVIVKTGSIQAIILSRLKLLELFKTTM
jgi:hypothetical protein